MQQGGRTFEFLEKYLSERYGISPEWMDQYFRRFIKQTMLHLVRMNLKRLLRHPGVFEIYGLDFLLDSKLKLWFLELNLTPTIVGSSQEKKKLHKKLIEDVVMLQFTKIFNENFDSVLKDSSFQWVFDGRKQGYQRYHNILADNCI